MLAMGMGDLWVLEKGASIKGGGGAFLSASRVMAPSLPF